MSKGRKWTLAVERVWKTRPPAEYGTLAPGKLNVTITETRPNRSKQGRKKK